MNVDVQAMARRLQESLGTVIVGKEAEIELCIVGLLCRGHLLIEDVPGTGKTLLAKALARSSGCSFERVQFTPDLLPGDVTGVSVYNPQQQTFEFRRGPIFAQVLLADEINRATPKTQSALLEAMEEWQVTVDGTSHPLPDPFMVLATQNPIELGGTFPLPEAQVDRFLLKLKLGYLPANEEVAMLDRFQSGSPLGTLEAVTDSVEIKAAQEVCRDIYCDNTLKDYCVRIVRRTREHRDVSLGRRRAAPSDCSTPGRRGQPSPAATSSCRTTSRRSRRTCSSIAWCSVRTQSCAASQRQRCSRRSWQPSQCR